jgi:hypothetical protein
MARFMFAAVLPYDHDWYLLSDLSRCVWESLKLFLQEAMQEKNFLLGAVIEI